MLHEDPRRFLMHLFQSALRAVQPEYCLPPHLPAPPKGRLVILAAGKAAASMAAAAERFYMQRWPGTKIEGIAVTRYGHTCPTAHVTVLEAAHPVPDEAGMRAARALLALATSLGPDDMGLVLLSGGASALLTLPPDRVSLEEKQALSHALLASGAPIGDLNTVRQHLSRTKGGQLAKAIAPARCVTLAISDVAGNTPATIGSGPTVPALGSARDAQAILNRLGIQASPNIVAHLAKGNALPAADDPCFTRATYKVIATGTDALSAAASLAREEGYEVSIVGDDMEGEARTLAISHARMACSHTNPGVPRLILSGGEANVTLGNKRGTGGPNQEFALALAIALAGERNVHAIACDTDGIDGGSGDAGDPAGAIISSRTLERGEALGLDARKALEEHDAGSFFAKLGDLVMTGPTLTNVNDFRAILVTA
ncbi:MAG: DUF4147 domain-containing protein [Parvibaculum sp.]